MLNKLRNVEKKFYEIIGIKIFRKMAFALRIFLFSFDKLSKEERKRILNEPSNYNMKKGNGIQDLRDFKDELKFNSRVHIIGVIVCLVGFVFTFSNPSLVVANIIWLFFLILNAYCVMLQRYNLIRIHEAEEKYEKLQELRKKRQKRLAHKKELSVERINELINLLDTSAIINNESLKEQGYSKVVDAKSYFEKLDANDPFNPDYWLNINKQKTLTRKVSK